MILGEPHPQVPLSDAIEKFGLSEHVFVRTHQDLADFDGYLGACDAVLNLRQNTFGETSGTMMRALGLGKAVVVSDIGSAQDLPDDACVKIPKDQHEIQVISECLKWLASDPDAVRDMGASAREWVKRECTWETVASRYAEFLGRVVEEPVGSSRAGKKLSTSDAKVESAAPSTSAVQSYLSRWIDFDSSAGGYYQSHSIRLPRTLQLTPKGDRDSRILELGCYMQITPALSGLLGYGEVRGAYLGQAGGHERSQVTATDGEVFRCSIDLFDCELDRYPYPDNYFDTVLCCELFEHLEKDPVHLMREVHRVLRPSGILVLTTPNAVSFRAGRAMWLGVHPHLHSKYIIPTLTPDSRHYREYTPKELIRLFGDTGFMLQHVETTPYCQRPGKYHLISKALESLKSWIPLREDCVYLVGQKADSAWCRYPAWLYEQV